jgi:hypothetical protein
MKLERTGVGQVVARRVLSEKGFPRRKIIVSLGMPRPDRHKGGDWECPFLIEGIGQPKVQKGFGVDTMQALIVALRGIRVTLDCTRRDLFWLDPEMGMDLPLNLPTWGNEFDARVQLAIERETVRVWRAKIKVRKAKIRADEAELKKQGKRPGEIAKQLAERKKHLKEWKVHLDQLMPGWSVPEAPT